MASTIPLVARAADAVLYRLPGRTVTAGEFAGAAADLAASLPESGTAINVCAGRYAFALAFAAALLRGHVSLLTSDRSPGRLQALARRFPGSYTIDDSRAAAAPACRPAHVIPDVPGDRPAAIVFTSGSTGQPVGHAKTWAALATRSQDAAVAFGIDPANPASIAGTVPPQHMYGFETTILWPLHADVSVWCGPAFYPADIRAALAASQSPRLLVTTPLQLRGLLQGPALPRLSRIISATAPLDSAMAAAAERAWDTEAWEIFGATEVGSIAARRTLAGGAWTPYPSVDVRAEADQVWVDAPGAPATKLDDVLDLHADGRFTLLGRRSDLVKLAGRRASLAGLNRILCDIEGVEDGVFVPPDARGHHAARMTAFVVAPGRAPAAILAELRTRIDPVFLPRRLVQVDSLPRNEFGKLPVQALEDLQEAS